jgi:hypothetical protein
MRFIFKLILIGGLSYLLELFLPWWSVVLAAFMVNLWLPTRGISAFLSGVLGIGMLWLIYAWLIDMETSSIISERIASLFGVGNPVAMIIITSLAGGLVGGFAAMSGSHFRRISMKDIPQRGYYS